MVTASRSERSPLLWILTGIVVALAAAAALLLVLQARAPSLKLTESDGIRYGVYRGGDVVGDVVL